MEEFGPVQLLVVGFENGNFTGAILDELRRLREFDIVRLVDLMFVNKDADGNVLAIEHSDLTEEESAQFGAIVGALVGFGAEGEEGLEAGAEAGALMGERASEEGWIGEEEAWYIADVIPEGSSAAVALIEHRWAIPLRDAILAAGGLPVANEWIHPMDLIAAGMGAASSSEE
jgi:uncharacterized membrane protein